MFSFVLIAVFVSFSSAFTLPQSDAIELPSLINSNDCNFYPALNTLYECTPKSHLLTYSYKYCQRSIAASQTFENSKYLADVRQCLQQNLYDKIRQAQAGTVTCDTFKQMDLDSHASCFAVSYKTLSANDIQQLFAIYKDTTLAFPQFCKLANSVAGYWSQIVNGDLMQFTKKELKAVFPDGDTTACTIKEVEIPDVIEEIVADLTKIVDAVNDIKDDLILIIEKAKSIHDDFKTIQATIDGIKNGSIDQLDGIKLILQKTKDIVDSARTIIATIKKMVDEKAALTGNSAQVGADIDRALQDMISIIDEIQAMKSEVYNVLDNVYTIIDTINEIRNGEKDIFDGLEEIVNQISGGINNINSIINTTDMLQATVIDLVKSIVTDVSGIIGTVGGNVDEIVGTVGGNVGGVIGGITGGIGGIGK